MKSFANRPRPPGDARGGDSGFAPDALAVAPRHLEVGGQYVASFAITGYPREVHPGWLQPLLTYPGRVDVSLHIDPIDPVTAAGRLKRQLAKMESGRRYTHEHGRLPDPQIEAATEDAYDLSARVARGEGKLYRLGLYLTVHATSQDELADEVTAVRALAASLLLDAKPTTYRSLQGWVTCLPMGLDQVRMRRTFDTAALSAAFPFTSPDLPPPDPASVAAPSGVLYGYNIGSQGLVHWDRFALDNHNAVILGRSGAGKSYLVKLELLRSLYRGIETYVIDPEDEYARLAGAVGGTYVHLGAEGVRLNPFDLPLHVRPDGRRTAPKDALLRRSLFLHTVLAVLLGAEPSPTERAVLDQAITTTYQRAGITADPRTWTRPAPLLADLAHVLERSNDRTATGLAAQLHPYVEGAFAGLFDGPTSTRPDGHLVVFSLRDLADELKAIGTLLTLDAVWRRVSNPAARRPRLVTVDEAWLLMQQPAGAGFLFRMAKAARKHWAGLTVATQDTADVLGSDLGKAVVANAATQILLRQAPQAIDEITRTFNLSDGERQFLLSADRGQGLLSTGTQRVAFQAIASPTEHHLITTDPAELAAYDDNAGAAAGDEQPYLDLDDYPPQNPEAYDDHLDLGEAEPTRRPVRLLTQNREMRAIGVWNWTLPAWAGRFPDGRSYNTCPSAGICRHVCYARHGTYRWPVVKAKHEANLRFVLDDLPGWERAMAAELDARRFHDAWVRIHDSGDFFCDAYLLAWLRIIRARPDTAFYAYTKEVGRFRALVEPDPPSNFLWVYSFGGTQDNALDTAVDRVADVFPDEAAITADGWHSQEASDLLAVLGPHLVGIPANRIPHFLKLLGNRTFRSWQAEVDAERRAARRDRQARLRVIAGGAQHRPLPGEPERAA